MTGRRRPDEPSLTPRAVVVRALALAEAEGLDAVTVRRLARDLQVTPMALYWHFRSKDELLDGMAAAVFEQIVPPADPRAPWPDQLRSLLTSMADVLRAHRSVAPLLVTRTVSSDGALRTTEAVLEVLHRGGFPPAQATRLARLALSTLAHLVGGPVGVVLTRDVAEQGDARERARLALESLPPERYPRLVEAARPLTEGEPRDTYLAFGLDLLVAGITAMAAQDR